MRLRSYRHAIRYVIAGDKLGPNNVNIQNALIIKQLQIFVYFAYFGRKQNNF
jgi:hypothetical protein